MQIQRFPLIFVAVYVPSVVGMILSGLYTNFSKNFSFMLGFYSPCVVFPFKISQDISLEISTSLL